MKIAVVGTGYVGISNALLLAKNHEVIAFDISPERVLAINHRNSPISDIEISAFIQENDLNIRATLCKQDAFENADYVIVATPTDYCINTSYFDTSTVESVIRDIIDINPNTTIIIKSTVPVGYTEQLKKDLGVNNLVFSPEFLREGKAIHDNLNPSRIIVGEKSKRAQVFAHMMSEAAEKKDIEVLFLNSTEAEAVKLFSNTYLAMRIAYFNELDSFSEIHNLDTRQIISGVCSDPRIGKMYNNPSFGYGGYCLPKDTKQLLANYQNVPNNIIRAIVEANTTRILFIADSILKRNPKKIGIYRLIMKTDSNNFRTSSVLGVIDELKSKNVDICIYEPSINENYFLGLKVVSSLNEFKSSCDIIVANRVVNEIRDISSKVYTRDIFGVD